MSVRFRRVELVTSNPVAVGRSCCGNAAGRMARQSGRPVDADAEGLVEAFGAGIGETYGAVGTQRFASRRSAIAAPSACEVVALLAPISAVANQAAAGSPRSGLEVDAELADPVLAGVGEVIRHIVSGCREPVASRL